MKFYSARTATTIIVANMVGAGIFMSLGEQLTNVPAAFPLLLLWLIGGISVLCGAMCYAELGGALPRSGGEYNFLGRIYHPAAGFISGWISATVGFAAPIAAVAVTFGSYMQRSTPEMFAGWDKFLAILLVILATAIHSRNRSSSSLFQQTFTALKIIIVLLFCFTALALVKEPQPVYLLPKAGDVDVIFSEGFAQGMIFVYFSYAGWNAATYIIGEMENPAKDLVKVLFTGTAFVTALYLLVNYTLLKTTPMDALVGKSEVLFISSTFVFDDLSARMISFVVACLLISSVSAMTLAGPRAIQAIGEDYKVFAPLGVTTKNGLPMRAILLQSAIAIALILTASFKSILIFAGAMLALNSLLAVLGVIVLRFTQPNLERPYRVWLYPITPLVFIIFAGITIFFTVKGNSFTAILGGILIGSGLLIYLATQHFEKSNSSD